MLGTGEGAGTGAGAGGRAAAGAGVGAGVDCGGGTHPATATQVSAAIAVRSRRRCCIEWLLPRGRTVGQAPGSGLPGSAAVSPRARGGKRRIDQLLVERGLAESRARAQALVMAGLVFAGETRVDKPGQQVREDAAIEVRGRDHPWVGRGGVKLAHAIEHFGLDPKGAVAMDIGSSTGGFTEVLLAHGAAHIFAVDVGTNQLAWKLRQDPRVTVLEQTNARALTAL